MRGWLPADAATTPKLAVQGRSLGSPRFVRELGFTQCSSGPPHTTHLTHLTCPPTHVCCRILKPTRATAGEAGQAGGLVEGRRLVWEEARQ